MTVVASAIGPLLLAKTFERTGSYDLMFYTLAGLVTVLGVCSWWTPLPDRAGPALDAPLSQTAASAT